MGFCFSWLKPGALLLLLAATCACRNSQSRQFLAVNEDNDRLLRNAKPEQITEQGLLSYLDSVLDGGAVTHFFMCVSGQRVNFPSKTWEPIWLGLNEPDRSGKTNNLWCVNAKVLADKGGAGSVVAEPTRSVLSSVKHAHRWEFDAAAFQDGKNVVAISSCESDCQRANIIWCELTVNPVLDTDSN